MVHVHRFTQLLKRDGFVFMIKCFWLLTASVAVFSQKLLFSIQ